MNTPQPRNETELIRAVGEWADANFDVRDSALGIAEEIGEAIHCLLKRKQMIRGFDDEQFFIEHFTDALADTVIYLCDWCHIHHAFFAFARNLQNVKPLAIEDQDKIIIHMLQGAAAIIGHDIHALYDESSPTSVDMANLLAQRLVNGLEMWAKVYEIELKLAVAGTWAKVSQRDWRKNPKGEGV